MLKNIEVSSTDIASAVARVHVVNFDYSMIWASEGYPYIDLKGNSTLVPVIRVFGSNTNRQKVCAHVHGVLPYFYFRPTDHLDSSFESIEVVERGIECMHRIIEGILNVKRPQYHIKCNSSGSLSTNVFIHEMKVVEKIPIYGYYEKAVPFVKISLYNPADVNAVKEMLLSGCLHGKVMQPYEAHIPYLLQFTMDNNILPMGWLHISEFHLRGKEPSTPASTIHSNIAVPQSKDRMVQEAVQFILEHPELIFTQNNDTNINVATAAPASTKFTVKKVTTCEVELDMHISHCINRHMPPGKFGAEIWEEERRRQVKRNVEVTVNKTPPATNTVHRQLFQAELDYHSRLDNLIKKGKSMASKPLTVGFNATTDTTAATTEDVDVTPDYTSSQRSHFDAIDEPAADVWLKMTQDHHLVEAAVNGFTESLRSAEVTRVSVTDDDFDDGSKCSDDSGGDDSNDDDHDDDSNDGSDIEADINDIISGSQNTSDRNHVNTKKRDIDSITTSTCLSTNTSTHTASNTDAYPTHEEKVLRRYSSSSFDHSVKTTGTRLSTPSSSTSSTFTNTDCNYLLLVPSFSPAPVAASASIGIGHVNKRIFYSSKKDYQLYFSSNSSCLLAAHYRSRHPVSCGSDRIGNTLPI